MVDGIYLPSIISCIEKKQWCSNTGNQVLRKIALTIEYPKRKKKLLDAPALKKMTTITILVFHQHIRLFSQNIFPFKQQDKNLIILVV